MLAPDNPRCPLKVTLDRLCHESTTVFKAVVKAYSDREIISLNYDALLEHKQKLTEARNAVKAANKAYKDHIISHVC